MIPKIDLMAQVMMDITLFTEHASGLRLRSYQLSVANAVLESILKHYGDTIVIMFPRQSGKNELQAQLQTYLLSLYSLLDAEMVQVSPTWKPQTQNAMQRLERVLKRNYHTQLWWVKEAGYIYRVGQARIAFLSGSPTTNVVGATANLLLSCDEAQDVGADKWDKDFAPMAASRDATRLFWGTAWTSKTLLARELRAARQREKDTGRRLAFALTADDVRKDVPSYGKFVDGQVARLGRNHPLVRTQFYSEEIDSEGGMFPPGRIALMRGSHPPMDAPRVDAAGSRYMYALLLDVAGEDEAVTDLEGGTLDYGRQASGGRRDSTALTVVEVDLSSLSDELVQAPTYRVIHRREWVGVKHSMLYWQIKALAEHWQARYLVCDATGVGAGLVSFLDRALPGRVIPFIFTQKSKSDLGWAFLAVIETGRYKEYSARSAQQAAADLQRKFFLQIEECQSTILEGPGKTMRWGVPEGTRDGVSGQLVHDDLLISAALCAMLDRQAWGVARSGTVHVDPLSDLGEVY